MRLHLLFAAPAILLVACPTTEACPAGTLWHPDRGMCITTSDTGPFDGGRDAPGEDAPCGGCTAPLICDTASNTCVECLGTDASSCTTGLNACVGQHCVACAEDADCEELGAAQCNTTSHTCEACTSNTACTGRTGTEVCNAGTCVECNAADESACSAGVCDVAMGTCTTLPEHSAIACRACVNDRQCADGQLCVPSEFPTGTVIGHHCAWREDASVAGGPMGMCGRVRPYVRAGMARSVNGVDARVCTPAISTCEALRDFRGVTCSPPGPTANPMCGAVDVADGFCRTDPSLGDRCSVGCTSNDDCPCTDGTCARQYRCNSGFCDFDCNCAVGTSSCMLLGGGACL